LTGPVNLGQVLGKNDRRRFFRLHRFIVNATVSQDACLHETVACKIIILNSLGHAPQFHASCVSVFPF
jgi:hypothetical protein